MLRFIALLSWLLVGVSAPLCAAKPSVALVVEDTRPLAGYDFIGEYLVSSITRVRNGVAISSPIADTHYRVYSNGAELRLYQGDLTEAHHSYKIYRSDGISRVSANGSMTIQPGIQARQISGELVKHLSLTQSQLTLTKFPPISDTVIVIYAKRLSSVE